MYYMIGYDKCSTCIKAMKHLNDKGISYTFLDVKKNPPTKEVLLKLICSVENRHVFWNTSGKLYAQMEIKNKKDDYTNEQMAVLLASQTMLIKRPILFDDKKILVGYKKENYENL